MSTERIDKTRKNIGAEQLNESEKKQLFNRFVEGGGQVVKEKKRRPLADFDREKQQQFRSKIDAHTKMLREGDRRAASQSSQPARQATKNSVAVAPPAVTGGFFISIIRFVNRWRIRVRIFMMGVTDFYGEVISRKFLARFNSDFKSALLELQLLYLDIFKQNHRVGGAVLEDIDRLNPLYYELMEMSAEVFDRGLINQIVEHHVNFPHIDQKAAELREPFLLLFKKLYVLYPYKESILLGFERAIEIQMRLEKGKASLYAMKRKKIRHNVAVVFNRLYVALYWLFCNYIGDLYLMKDPAIANILGISDNDLPGKRTRAKSLGMLKQKDEAVAEDDDVKAEKKEELPEAVRKGLEIMHALDLKSLRSVYDKTGTFRQVRDNDKILLAYLLFREFDEEYSFVLTTNKIKYNVLFTGQGKVDYRIRLSDLYDELRRCMNVFKDYADAMDAYEKARSEKPTSSAQYMDYSNRLTGHDKKKSSVAKNVRMTVGAFMEKVLSELSELIGDMNAEQRIIDNPQAVLDFESSIEGDKKMNGRKVYEAVLTAYHYASAFIFRLGVEGDLYGEAELDEEQMRKMSTQAADEGPKDEGEGDEGTDEEGVLKELDDLF